MRVYTKWTPSGIVLWLIAAVVATLVVCNQTPPPDPRPKAPAEIEFEVETVD
ncbi:MAG: hypothetical protein OES69_05940 [Myxococcales bacterium]|nr:hypothetical protein [Myxococcales bacterium]MDH3843458.1 hypothetical protein [Myxococcales bacterium]